MNKCSVQAIWGLRPSPVVIPILACMLIGLVWSPAAANGVPVQVFLDHLPFKTTWTPASGGRGVATVAANDEQVRVMTQNLPAPPSGRVYYAWLEKVEGGFLPIGALDYRSDGTASLNQTVTDLPYSENFSWVLVSVEDVVQVGSAPGVDVALAGRLPNAMALPYREDQTPSLLPVTGANGSAGTLAVGHWIVLGLLFLVVASAVGGRRQGTLLARFVGRRTHDRRGGDQ